MKYTSRISKVLQACGRALLLAALLLPVAAVRPTPAVLAQEPGGAWEYVKTITNEGADLSSGYPGAWSPSFGESSLSGSYSYTPPGGQSYTLSGACSWTWQSSGSLDRLLPGQVVTVTLDATYSGDNSLSAYAAFDAAGCTGGCGYAGGIGTPMIQINGPGGQGSNTSAITIPAGPLFPNNQAALEVNCYVGGPQTMTSQRVYQWVDGAAAPPTATPTATPTAEPAAFKPPCEEPLYFYPNQDFSGFYTGKPSLNYTRDEMVNDLLRGMQRYAAGPGAKLEDGALPWDVANIAMTFTSDSTLPEGKQAAPALQQAARDLARARQATDANYRVSPGELLELSLKLNGGNVRNALVTCHAALYRDKEGVNKDFVEGENILAPLRNPDGYADTQWTYTTPAGSKRTANPKAIAQDQQGPWYHLYGMAALEYTDGYNAASFYGAQIGIWKTGDTSKMDALQKVRDKGMPVTGLGGVLGDLANALEEGIRSMAGTPPDIDKNCINYTGLKAGHEIRRLVNSPELVSPPPDDYTPSGQFRQDTDRVISMGKQVNFRSPLSLRIDGAGGEWFTFDQAARRFDGNTPYVVFDFFGEDNGTVGLVAQPLFDVSSMQLAATGSGTVDLVVYDPTTRRAEAYQFAVQPGDLVDIPGQEGPVLLNSSELAPVAASKTGGSLLLPLLIGTAVVLLLGAVAVVLLLRRRTARPVLPSQAAAPAPAPRVPPSQTAAAPAFCPQCGQPATPGFKFCNACGAPLAPAARPAQGAAGWQLVIVDGPGAGRRYPLGAETSLGRSQDNTIYLEDAQSSRHHALFRQTAQGYVVSDLGSTNGTLVNDRRIEQPALVRSGDRVQIGNTVLQVICLGSVDPAAKRPS